MRRREFILVAREHGRLRRKYRRAACYIDRILKGEKLADLPVQAPTKYVGTSSLSKENVMREKTISGGHSRRDVLRFAAASAVGLSLLISLSAASTALAQTSASVTGSTELPANWRDIKDGVGGYPAGPMLEIALRRTLSDKLEMFKWRSEFIAMLSAQPGPLVEREWHSIWGLPENLGAGTWTGMTWWENQQKWQDMANMLFTSPVAEKWLQTLNMTLIFVKPLDNRFDLHTQ